MREVRIGGAAMTRFGRHVDRSARELVEEAVAAALKDAEVEPRHVGAVYVGNAASGLASGQESIRGQVVLRHTGLLVAPIFNVENACASSSTALHLAWQAVAGGLYDCVVVVGYEKIDHRDPARTRRVINATMDLGELDDIFGARAGQERNVYMEVLAASTAGEGSERFDPELLALVAVKNHSHGALNPCAYRREAVSVEQVLGARPVAGPLTRLMCAPLTDGAACLVLCAEGCPVGRASTVRVAASVLSSGRGDDMRRRFSIGVAARQAYELAAVDPEDLDVIELYDATSISELYLYEELGLCRLGEAGRLVHDRVTWLGGRRPVNTSGGLIARGHPLGATGLAQVVELTWQLEGRCGPRQVPSPRLAMAENTGGWIGSDVAACCIHLLQT